MIYFNDVALESVAPVRIEDVRISPIERDVVARARAIEPGSFFVRSRDGTRTVRFLHLELYAKNGYTIRVRENFRIVFN